MGVTKSVPYAGILMKGHKNVIDCPKNQKGKNNTSKRKKTKKK